MNRSSMIRLASTALALLFSLVGAGTASAQTVEASQAADFLGSWSITLESPDGAVPFLLNVVDKAGTVEASIGVAEGESMVIPNLARTGDELVARYNMPYEGMDLPVVMSLKRDGENLQTSWDFMEGAFTTTAVGTKR